MIDKITRLERVTVGPGLLITYIYTLVNIEASEIDANKFKKNFIPNITNKVCSSSELIHFFENKVGVYLEYRGRNNKRIGRVPFELVLIIMIDSPYVVP